MLGRNPIIRKSLCISLSNYVIIFKRITLRRFLKLPMALDTPIVPPRSARIEWPTLGLIVLVYGGWLSLTWFHESVPLWLFLPLAAWITAWHGSVQHEILHGHPTRLAWLNTLLATPPLSLWLPYQSYRRTHLAHHRDDRLTDPLDDPESYYWTVSEWQALGLFGRCLIRAQGSLVGRLVIGPIWSIGRFFLLEARALIAGDRIRRRIWAWHVLHLVPVLVWVIVVCRMPLWLYLLAFVYGGTALLLVRSFAEHRAAGEVERRTAIVERSPLFGLLFLNNNLHVVHHTWPTVPWYRLPALYRQTREAVIAANGGLVYAGYLDVFRRFFFSRHDEPVHPLGRAPLKDGTAPSSATFVSHAGNG